MPQGSTRVDKALTNFSVQYKDMEAIFPKFLPTIPVVKESDKYWIYNRDVTLTDSRRANGAPANAVTWDASTSSYSVTEHSLKDSLTDRDRDNADNVFQLRVDTTEFLQAQIMRRQEFEVKKIIFTTTTFSNNVSLDTNTSWVGNTTTSAPVQTVLSGTSVIVLNAGKRPNTMVMGNNAFDSLRENVNIQERIKYVQQSIITEKIIASLFDIQQVHVGRMALDSSQDGLAASLGFLWDTDKALLAFFGPTGRKMASAAVGFRKLSKGNPWRVKRWRDEEIEGDWIEVQSMFSPKATATLSGYLFSSVTGVMS